MGGIPLRIRDGRLVAELPSKRRSGKTERPQLKVNNKKISRSGSERMEVYIPEGRRARPLFRVHHRDQDQLVGRRRVQQFWRVVDLSRIREPRSFGEQRMTIRDATLGGSIMGRTKRIARMNAERFYGRSLPEEDFALMKVEDWRPVRHLKSWPPEEEEEDFSEDLSVCLGVLSAVS